MNITYAAEILNAAGETQGVITDIIGLEAARAFNTVGTATLTLPLDAWYSYFRRDARLKIWRFGVDGTPGLFGDTVWLMRARRMRPEDDQMFIECDDAISLLDRRLVAYTPETAYADKTPTGYATAGLPDDRLRTDNMMRAYVYENLGLGCLDANRIAPWIRIQADTDWGPQGAEEAGFKTLLSALQDIANQSEQLGMKLYFDMVPQADGTFTFTVWKNMRSRDRGIGSMAPTVFSYAAGNLSDVEISENYRDEGTYCYVLGPDSGNSRIVTEVSNPDTLGLTPFSRIEFTVDATEGEDPTYLENAGKAALAGKRPKRILAGRIADNNATLYDRDYTYGDRVVAEAMNEQYDCQISAIHITWRENQEDLEARLTGEVYL